MVAHQLDGNPTTMSATPIVRRQRIRGHARRIYRLTWLSDGLHLLTSSEDKTIRIWEVASGKEARKPISSSNFRILDWSRDGRLIATNSQMSDQDIRVRNLSNNTTTWEYEAHTDAVTCLAWSPNSNYLATGSIDYMVFVWELRTRDMYRKFEHPAEVTCLAWHPSGRYLATGTGRGIDNNIRVFVVGEDKTIATLKGHSGAITCLAWHPNGRYLASGSIDRTIRLWDLKSGLEMCTLESHTDSITSLSFSPDGALLASKGQDETIRLWSAKKDWSLVTILRETGSDYAPCDLQFHPRLPLLATVGDNGTVIDIFEIDMDSIHEARPELPLVYYSNAKVVLVGEGSAGKTCLGRALMRQDFSQVPGTHGINVWNFHVDVEGERKGWGVKREILLWDLAGQDDYRLIHQLYLKDVALALLVYNGSSTEAFRSVRYWNRALDNMQRTAKNEAMQTIKFLVEARADQGRSNYSTKYIEEVRAEQKFERYFKTSALQGIGIDELRKAIREAIPWDSLPEVVSTQFFEIIRDFLKELQEKSNINVAHIHTLYEMFLQSGKTPNPEFITDLRKQFETCIEFLESTGIMRRFKFGGLVLLRPELLNFYASAIIDAAKEEGLEGFGRLREETVWNAAFPIPYERRLQNPIEEQWLLLATVDDLLTHEVALRDEGNYLIFPSQFVHENRDKFDHPGSHELMFRFEGSIVNLYATIVVRLARSNEFKLTKIARHNVQFEDSRGATFGLQLKDADAYGELLLYFSQDAQQVYRYMFEFFIHSYLTEQAQPGSVERLRMINCNVCGSPFAEFQVTKRKELGYNYMDCPVCGNRVSLYDPEIDENMQKILRSSRSLMARSADRQRTREAAKARLSGKMATDNYDVLMLYDYENMQDFETVTAVKDRLAQRGIYVWNEGSVTLKQAQRDVLSKVASVAVVIGSRGLGSFDAGEIKSFAEYCISLGKPFIFVIVPSADNIPPRLLEMREGVHWVYFFRHVDETSALDDLEKWITGVNPR